MSDENKNSVPASGTEETKAAGSAQADESTTAEAAAAEKKEAEALKESPVPAAASKDEGRLCRDDIRPPKMSAGRKASELLRKAVFWVAMVVLVGSVIFLGKSAYDYLYNHFEYASLNQYAKKDPDKPGKDPNKDPGKDPGKDPKETDEEKPSDPDETNTPSSNPSRESDAEILAKYDYTPMEVDFASLKEINSDVVGWIDIPSLNISYPMVLGENNDFYLRHSFKKIYNIGGAIFLDYRNNADFSDRNTVIYGHNQENEKMFSNLLKLTEAKDAKKCQLMVIYTPEKTLYYQVFSVRIRHYMDPVYGVSYTPAEIKSYGENALFESEYNYNAIDPFTDKEKIISLVTCCEDQDYRLLVHGFLINNEAKEAAQ